MQWVNKITTTSMMDQVSLTAMIVVIIYHLLTTLCNHHRCWKETKIIVNYKKMINNIEPIRKASISIRIIIITILCLPTRLNLKIFIKVCQSRTLTKSRVRKGPTPSHLRRLRMWAVQRNRNQQVWALHLCQFYHRK